jgi:hypothetical protein
MNNFVTQLRWPESLRNEIQEAARINRRSMNAEIVSRLEASLAVEARLEGRAA